MRRLTTVSRKEPYLGAHGDGKYQHGDGAETAQISTETPLKRTRETSRRLHATETTIKRPETTFNVRVNPLQDHARRAKNGRRRKVVPGVLQA
jgi:hypothetical protein